MRTKMILTSITVILLLGLLLSGCNLLNITRRKPH